MCSSDLFLLSLLEDISIDFPSHFILSLIDVYRDTVTRDKLIFLLAITRLLCHFSVSYPKSPHLSFICAIDAATVRVLHSFARGSPNHRRQLLWLLKLHPPLHLLLSWVESHLRPSWHNLCAWMLALTLSMSCVR